jgi:hypothetical protein
MSKQGVAGPWQSGFTTRAWPVGITIAASLVVGGVTCSCEVYDESLLVQGTSAEVADDESATIEANDETSGDSTPGDESTSSAASSAATCSTNQPAAVEDDGTPFNATDEPVDDDDLSGSSDEESEGFDESAEPTDTETSSDDSVSGETIEAGAPAPDGLQGADDSAPGQTEPTPELPEEDQSPADAGVTTVTDAGAPPTMPAETGTDPAPVDSAVWSFDADIMGWIIGFSDPTTLRGQSSLAFSATEGSPGPGSLSLDASFTTGGQRLAIQSPIAPTDLRGRTVTAMVLLDSGLSRDAANPSSVKLFAKSGSAYVFASGAPSNLLPDAGWVTIEFDIDQPDYTDPSATFDAADVREIGFELIAGATSSSIDGAVVYFDEVDY